MIRFKVTNNPFLFPTKMGFKVEGIGGGLYFVQWDDGEGDIEDDQE